MYVFHIHWQPPRRPAETGGLVFWAEDSNAPQPHGTISSARRITPHHHPFCLSAEQMQTELGAGTPLANAAITRFHLNLPTTRTGPQPSPELSHDWELDTESEPRLFPWTVEGLYLPAAKAFPVLVYLPDRTPLFVLGQDAIFWRKTANLVMETLAGQKLVPALIAPLSNGNGNGNGHNGSSGFYARWLPVLDGLDDAPRLERLVDSLPPVCRAEWYSRDVRPEGGGFSPAELVDTFLTGMCDALARSWAKGRLPQFTPKEDSAFTAWMSALFSVDAQVHASAGQLQALSSSLRAWSRNLQAAGDGSFRITFRLEAPQQQPETHEKTWQLHYLLQARDDPSLLIPAEEVWSNTSPSLRILGRRMDQPQEKLLAGLGYAARLFTPIKPSLQSSDPEKTMLDTPQAYEFLRTTAPLLEEAGFGLLAPPWWNQKGARLGVRLHLQSPKLSSAGPLMGSKVGLNQLVSFQWELALGETTLTRQEFETLAALKQPLVQIRGQWVQLDSENIEAAIRFWESQQQSGQISLMEVAQYRLGAKTSAADLPVTDVVAEGWVDEWLQKLAEPARMVELPQPAGLNGQLRPYQRYGYSWLAFFRRWGLGAILADDMGLGKTIQALALLLFEKEAQGKLPGPTLLIAPTSVVNNWEREAQRFAPSLQVMVHQGPNRARGDAFKTQIAQADLVLSSYAVVRQDAEFIQSMHWYGVILDEAQNIKNPSAKQTQAVRKLNASFRLALTGTPVENRLLELWSIMQFLNPGYLDTQEKFRSEIAIPIERFGDSKATTHLKQLVSPFILRRMKNDPGVIQDLPDKIEMNEYCTLTEEQASLYQAVVQSTLAKVNESSGIERHGLVLSLLTQLKQVCNHPLQYLHQVDEPNLTRAAITGRSGKLIRLTEMLEEVVAEGDRALVFTQFAQMGHILAAYLPLALGCSVQYLHGGTPIRAREQMIYRFQEDEYGPSIFILSLKAGGLGLNLTRANHVFHFDRWWNPAVEDQATDRAFRIGQQRNVQVHKFVTTGTLEERIDLMIESKKGLAEAVLGSGEAWLTELSTEELRDLVSLRAPEGARV